jgi:predicted nucleotidyltransferase
MPTSASPASTPNCRSSSSADHGGAVCDNAGERKVAEMIDREHVLRILAAHRAEFRTMGVRELSIFGSLARGEATEASDVDVLVDYEPGTPLSFFRVCELRYRIEDLLGAQVDVVTTGGLRPEIRDEVLNEAIRAA